MVHILYNTTDLYDSKITTVSQNQQETMPVDVFFCSQSFILLHLYSLHQNYVYRETLFPMKHNFFTI